jgi:hypothetical protein
MLISARRCGMINLELASLLDRETKQRKIFRSLLARIQDSYSIMISPTCVCLPRQPLDVNSLSKKSDQK